MSEQKPSVGRIVHYRVSEYDTNSNPAPITHNNVKPGDVLPAVVVRVWSDQCVNLRIVCDGPSDAWKTSVTLGDSNGNWSWPARV